MRSRYQEDKECFIQIIILYLINVSSIIFLFPLFSWQMLIKEAKRILSFMTLPIRIVIHRHAKNLPHTIQNSIPIDRNFGNTINSWSRNFQLTGNPR